MRKNKEQNDPLAPKPQGDVPNTTVKMVKTHIPDEKAVEGRAPFSFSAVRKILYQ